MTYDVILAAPFGVQIPATVVDGSVASAIPEPSSWLLYAAGIALVARKTRRQRPRATEQTTLRQRPGGLANLGSP